MPLTIVACLSDPTCHLCRLLSSGARAIITAEQHAFYLSDPAACKGMMADVLKSITPDYQELSEWLRDNEWITKEYEASYRRAIYESS